MIFCAFSSTLLRYYVSLVILLMVFLFHRLSHSFAYLLEGKNEKQTKNEITILMNYKAWSRISRNYNTLQRFTDEVNSTFGTQISLFLMQFLIGYAVALNEFFALGSEDKMKSSLYVFWVFVSFFTLYWAADACRRVSNTELCFNFIHIILMSGEQICMLT